MRPARSELRIFRNGAELARAAADEFHRRLLLAGAAGRRFTCALSGGSTPRALFKALAAREVRAALPDEIRRSLHFFWSDERSVPPGHRDSNFGMACEILLRHAALPEANIHRIPAELGASLAADAYELELRRFFRLASGEWPVFNLIYLGLGEDGHTASLFPGSDVVGERHRLAAAVRADQPGRERITLTLPVLNHAACVTFLVAGAQKARILREVLEASGPDRELPARL
ncbi:MAG: 6-phosphogluconolactonase, partial [Acidobacteria bacterium]|nr:6-phosphogluconolactonase [Acidobacteriota bacterium]